MDVNEIMHKEVEKASPETTVSEAAARMTEKDISYLVVVKGSKLAGIVTEDDIIKKVVGKGKHPQETTLGEIMVKEVVHITPDKTLEEAAEMMTQKEIKKLPVVEGKKLLGIVTATDMIAAEPKMMENLGELVLLARKQKKIAG
jgi:CBS domain-containing protein